jgi:hypothetical protein
MEPKVCVLSTLEARELVQFGIAPDCSMHRHIKSSEACEMTGDSASKIYFKPVARWIGKDGRRITMLELHLWSSYSVGCRMNGWALMRTLPRLRAKEKCRDTRAEGT